jgi:D-tyrosyl-tRNA(Tyr) deacylase
VKAVLQRVSRADVKVGGVVKGAIGPGLLAFVAVVRGDADAAADALARKILDYRVFEDDAGKMNRAVLEAGGALLVVSQFTLAADGKKGRRPSFDDAAPPAEAARLLDRVVARLREAGARVETGEFGATMEVSLVNIGPATFILDVGGG